VTIKENTVIIIVGPTAVGKTSFAVKLAQYFQTAIISADSRQCYRELNIGVAKPSEEELRLVHHYFINSHAFTEEVNAGTFEQYALKAADSIFKDNKIAVMVGGTGLYIKTFCEGMDSMPKVEEGIRQAINEQYHSNGIQWLQNEIREKDPAFWQVAEQQNPHRIMRALEILVQTGKSITTFRQQKKELRPFNIIKIGLELPRQVLYTNINNRVDEMMHAGLLDEVNSLLPFRSLNALQTVGYKEIFHYIDGSCSISEAVDQIKKNTRHYAKRQMTWFKKDMEVQWVHPLQAMDLMEDILKSKDL
jgi:tRNA dimethylallyltransferase